MLSQYPLPTELHTAVAHTCAAAQTLKPSVKYNFYRSTILNTADIPTELLQYYGCDVNCVVTLETVLVPVMPTHVDAAGIGSEPRQSHVVLNIEPMPITVIVGEAVCELQPMHWLLLHSQTAHSATCVPPHSVLCFDAGLRHCDYADVLKLSA